MCCCATTRAFPYILVTSGSRRRRRSTKHRGARSGKGDYFGPFASVRRGRSHAQRACSAPFLLRTCSDSYLRQPHAALPALPDQALLRPRAPVRFRYEDYRAARRRGARFSVGQEPRGARSPGRRRWSEAAEALAFEKRGAPARPHRRALGDPGRARTSIRTASLRPTSSRIAEEAGQFCIEVFFFRTYPELGQPRLFSARRPEP